MEKCFEDVRQDEKHVPDLLESIMRPTDPVKEELRPNSCKVTQIRSKIIQFKVSTFWIPEIRSFPAGGQCQPPHQYVLSNNASEKTRINPIFGPAKTKYWKTCGF